MARDFAARLTRRAGRAGLFLNDELVGKLDAFYALLTKWNAKINLTALSDVDESIDRLILEPLFASRHVPAEAGSMMDVGSGGGSPAIPMKLAIPRLSLSMVEVKARKSAFLREAIRHLDLQDARVETTRVEELLTRTELHEAFDLVTMRAVRVETKVLHTAQAFLRAEGQLYLFRGPIGPSTPALIVPPLQFVETVPLVDALQSRLTILSKRIVGVVPREPPRAQV